MPSVLFTKGDLMGPVPPLPVFLTRIGFTHCGAAGTNAPVLFCEFDALKSSAVAVALTDARLLLHMRAKKIGRFVLWRLTVIRGFPWWFVKS